MGRPMRSHLLLASLLMWSGLALAAADPPEVTDDGLVRAPSSSKVGVFRLPEATFNQYRRVMFAPIEVKFKKGWEKNHKETTAEDRQKLRDDLAKEFRSELVKELVTRGGFAETAETAPDVLRVEASILDLDVAAPKASSAQMQHTFVRTAGSMKLVVELEDASSGVTVARLINYESAREYLTPQLATQISNIAELRVGFENTAKYTHEAIAVARSEKREEQAVIKSEN